MDFRTKYPHHNSPIQDSQILEQQKFSYMFRSFDGGRKFFWAEENPEKVIKVYNKTLQYSTQFIYFHINFAKLSLNSQLNSISTQSKAEVKTNFDGRRLLIEDNLWWKTKFDGRQPLIEDNLWMRTFLYGRQPLMEDNL